MKKLGLYLPIDRRIDYLVTTVATSASLAPVIGFIPSGVSRLANLGLIGPPDNLLINATCAGTALALSPFFISRGKMLFPSDPTAGMASPQHAIDICGMPCREDALFTGVLILGSTGSGKTSSAILPPLDQIFKKYNHPGFDPKDTLLNIGGFCLDAKMEFYEPILYFMHDAGRNILEDACVVRPNCFIPVGDFIDPDTDNHFFLPGQSYSTQSEVERLIISSEEATNAGIVPNFLMKRTDDRMESEKKLQNIVFDVSELDLNYLGWRRSGNILHPLKSLKSMREFEVDASVSVPCPKRLIYHEMTGVDTGIRYNIVNNRVSSAVAGKRLANIASLVDGGEGAKKDPYWDKQAANLFAQVMDAWQLLDPKQAHGLFALSTDSGTNVTVRRDLGGPDILRIVEQADTQEKLVMELKSKKDKLAQHALALKGRNRVLEREAIARHRKSDDLIKYFETTWRQLAPNTKSIIESCVRNMFGPFAQDDLLAESFCSPATISFDEMITKGKFFFYVAGNDYRDLAKVMGTSLKLDAHSVVLSRKARGELNKIRRIMEVIDECQMYAVAGEGGDQETKSMSRSSKLFHINATQSEASLEEVVGHSRYGTYIQAYGVRVMYNLMDEKSRKSAAALTGQVYRELKDIVADNLTYEHILGMKGSSGKKENTQYRKEQRFSEYVFLELDTHESITYNKDRRRKDGEDKVHRQYNKPHPIGGPEMASTFELFMRDYGRCYAEYCVQNTKWNPEGMRLFHAGVRLPIAQSSASAKTATPAPTTVAPNSAKVEPSKSGKSSPLVQNKPPAPSVVSQPAAGTPPVVGANPPAQNAPSNIPAQQQANRDANKVRDPNADERPAARKGKPHVSPNDPVIKPPPAHLLKPVAAKPQQTQSELPITDDSESTRVTSSPRKPSIEEATKRLELGQATPLDMEVINEWGSKHNNQVAMVSSYFESVRIDGLEVVATQSIARMAEGGGNAASVHRGPRGLNSGVPQGRGSQPGTPTKIDLPSDALDLSTDSKMVADSLVRAAEKASKDALKDNPPLTLENLRKKFGTIP